MRKESWFSEAAGDCADAIYRQAVLAAGMGCMAALEAEKLLAAQPLEPQVAGGDRHHIK